MGRTDGPRSWEVWSTTVLIKQEKAQQYHWGDGFGMGSIRSGQVERPPGLVGVLGRWMGCMRGMGCCSVLHPSEQVRWSQAGEPPCETAH